MGRPKICVRHQVQRRSGIARSDPTAARQGKVLVKAVSPVPSLSGHPRKCSMPNMTGRPGYRTMEVNGGSSGPYLACTPCVPLFCTLFNRGGNRGAFRLPGAGGDHFHCAVEPSPGHIWCRNAAAKQKSNDGNLFFGPPPHPPLCGGGQKIINVKVRLFRVFASFSVNLH